MLSDWDVSSGPSSVESGASSFRASSLSKAPVRFSRSWLLDSEVPSPGSRYIRAYENADYDTAEALACHAWLTWPPLLTTSAKSSAASAAKLLRLYLSLSSAKSSESSKANRSSSASLRDSYCGVSASMLWSCGWCLGSLPTAAEEKLRGALGGKSPAATSSGPTSTTRPLGRLATSFGCLDAVSFLDAGLILRPDGSSSYLAFVFTAWSSSAIKSFPNMFICSSSD